MDACRYGGTGVKAVLQHGFMCTVETTKERVLLPDVEEHMRVDVPSILVGNRRTEEGRRRVRWRRGGRRRERRRE